MAASCICFDGTSFSALSRFLLGATGIVVELHRNTCFTSSPQHFHSRLPENTERKRGRRRFVHFEVNRIKGATLEIQLSAAGWGAAYAVLPGLPLLLYLDNHFGCFWMLVLARHVTRGLNKRAQPVSQNCLVLRLRYWSSYARSIMMSYCHGWSWMVLG